MAETLRQVATAFVWLTRLPMPWLRPVPLSGAVWAFPLVGLVVAGSGAAVLLLSGWLGLPTAACALVALGAMALATGGLHEDGLADFADGHGGQTRNRALEIMRDSRIGTYGVLALIFVTGLRVAALAALSPWQAAAALIGAGAASRAGMAAGLRMPPARMDGLGHAAGRPGKGAVCAALALGAGVLLCAGGLVPLAACAAAQFLIARAAMRRLGGQTGDVLGAMQQAGEVAALLAICATA